MIPEIIRHYTESGLEKERLLSTATGMLELARTVDILDRFLPPPPASILDIGGGAGLYSCLLAERGYSVNLFRSLNRNRARFVDFCRCRGYHKSLLSVARREMKGETTSWAPEEAEGVMEYPD